MTAPLRSGNPCHNAGAAEPLDGVAPDDGLSVDWAELRSQKPTLEPLKKLWCEECGGHDGKHVDGCERPELKPCCQARFVEGSQCELVEHGDETKHRFWSAGGDITWVDPLAHARVRLERARRELAAAEAEWAAMLNLRTPAARRGAL